jgi:hypothetical protein
MATGWYAPLPIAPNLFLDRVVDQCVSHSHHASVGSIRPLVDDESGGDMFHSGCLVLVLVGMLS